MYQISSVYIDFTWNKIVFDAISDLCNISSFSSNIYINNVFVFQIACSFLNFEDIRSIFKSSRVLICIQSNFQRNYILWCISVLVISCVDQWLVFYSLIVFAGECSRHFTCGDIISQS
eukprot:NODE_36_length_36011_cov_1.012920.p22 type:complete len:118 gc:universal NODE_36_length_36011_cov_1.012920:16191-16544(+)